MNVTTKEFLDFTTGVDVVHVGIQNYLKHQLGIIRRASSFPIKSLYFCKVEMLNYMVQDSHRIIIRNIFIDSLRKKDFCPCM